MKNNPIIIESTTTHTTTTRTIKVSNDMMEKIQNARNAAPPEYKINFNIRDESGKMGFCPFETKPSHKFRGQPV